MPKRPDIDGDPNFDPHRDGKRGALIGASVILLGLAAAWLFGLI